MKDKIMKLIENYEKEFIDISQYIYENPELGFEEYKSSKAHIDLLKKHNFQVEENYLGFDTAFKAVYQGKKSGPNIAYLVEYDALPDIGHGCGHNLLGTTSSAAGIVLRYLVDEIGGNVYVFGTPAEETSGVKVDMVEEGSFDNIDIAMMAHPNHGNRKSGGSMDLYPVEFIFTGKSSHAAAAPERGINALDACIQTFNNINALREHIRETSRIHGIITEGGLAANIVPERAVAQFYIRTPEVGYIDELKEKVINCAKAAALATGAKLELNNFEKPYRALVTNKTLSDLYDEKLRSLGVEDIQESDSTGSLDMGNVSQVCPSIHPYFDIIGPGKKRVASHTKEFADSTLKGPAHDGMKKAIYALVASALDVIVDKDLLKQIKDEFQNFKDMLEEEK